MLFWLAVDVHFPPVYLASVESLVCLFLDVIPPSECLAHENVVLSP